jgi:fimbrial chaperone protein
MTRKMTKWAFILPLCLGMNLLSISSALAGAMFQLDPPSREFAPSGGGATQSFEIISNGDQPVAVQIQVTKRVVALDGIETNPIEENDFLVYPPQIVVEPGKQQTIKVTWLGDPNPAKELSYRLIAEQVPVNLTEVTATQQKVAASVKILFKYGGAIYITPNNAAPRLVIESASPQKTKDGKDELVLTLENQGTAHQLLRGIKIVLTPNQGQAIKLTKDQLKEIETQNVLAGNKRQFVLPWPKELPVSPVTATFETNP